MAAWFSVLLFSDKKYFLCSIIILLSCVANIAVVDVFKIADALSYVDEKGFFIKLDGLTAVLLIAAYSNKTYKDELASRMSLLLAFAIFCHTMIIYDLTFSLSLFNNIFYTWYDELIITIGILQMVISRNGITSALQNLRAYLFGLSFHYRNHSKSVSTRKKAGERT